MTQEGQWQPPKCITVTCTATGKTDEYGQEIFVIERRDSEGRLLVSREGPFTVNYHPDLTGVIGALFFPPEPYVAPQKFSITLEVEEAE